jgi:5-methylcytosine-specific restriction protein A
MARSVAEWIGRNDDTPAPPRVRLRVFEAYGGRCHWSGQKINVGDVWDLDHIRALINGGENRESNLAPILRGKPHKEKTAADVSEKSKVARVRAKHLGIFPTPAGNSRLQGRPFQKSRTMP